MNTSKSLEAVRRMLEDRSVTLIQKEELNSFIEDVPQALVRKVNSDQVPEVVQEYMKNTRRLSINEHHNCTVPLSSS
jgi:hypothetical protein